MLDTLEMRYGIVESTILRGPGAEERCTGVS